LHTEVREGGSKNQIFLKKILTNLNDFSKITGTINSEIPIPKMLHQKIDNNLPGSNVVANRSDGRYKMTILLSSNIVLITTKNYPKFSFFICTN
jgi:hypothetical protein